jgi:hypothetical protein
MGSGKKGGWIMRKLILPRLVGLCLLLQTLGTAHACVRSGRLLSPPRPGSEKQPKIAFKTDGNDCIASIQVTANNSPHALWTSYHVSADHVVTLSYCLIQNSDRFVRSLKTVTIEWRLKYFAVMPLPPLTYRVEGTSISPNSQELKGLMPQLQLLIADRAAGRLDEPVEAVVVSTKEFDSKNKTGEILVKVVKGNSLLGEKRARVGITAITKLEKLVDGKRVPVRFEDLKEGCTIQFSGFRGVGESYPVFVGPTSIIIREEPTKSRIDK